MDKTITLELRVREAGAAAQTDSRSGDDSAGHALQTPTAVDSIYRLSPRFAVLLTLPDPAPPVVQTEDVQGFIWPLVAGFFIGGMVGGWAGAAAGEEYLGESKTYHKDP